MQSFWPVVSSFVLNGLLILLKYIHFQRINLQEALRCKLHLASLISNPLPRLCLLVNTQQQCALQLISYMLNPVTDENLLPLIAHTKLFYRSTIVCSSAAAPLIFLKPNHKSSFQLPLWHFCNMEINTHPVALSIGFIIEESFVFAKGHNSLLLYLRPHQCYKESTICKCLVYEIHSLLSKAFKKIFPMTLYNKSLLSLCHCHPQW